MRSIWKGAISFGMVYIPVNLYPASRSRELKFKLLHKKDHSEIRYARICKTEGKEVPWEEIVKGFEVSHGDYVIMTDEDFEKASLKKSRTIEILDFTAEDQIDTMYFQTPYYLEPAKGAAGAYILLRDALKQSKKVAVGHFVFRQHEHLGVIKAHGNLLVLNMLRYESELINPKDLNVPKKESAPKKELAVALQLIEQLTKPFHPEEYSDTYTDEVKEIIRKKSKGQKVTIKKGEAAPKSTKVHDIMTLLKSSLKKAPKKPAKKRRAA